MAETQQNPIADLVGSIVGFEPPEAFEELPKEGGGGLTVYHVKDGKKDPGKGTVKTEDSNGKPHDYELKGSSRIKTSPQGNNLRIKITGELPDDKKPKIFAPQHPGISIPAALAGEPVNGTPPIILGSQGPVIRPGGAVDAGLRHPGVFVPNRD